MTNSQYVSQNSRSSLVDGLSSEKQQPGPKTNDPGCLFFRRPFLAGSSSKGNNFLEKALVVL